jgi:iron complex transport system substrate-binding protein
MRISIILPGIVAVLLLSAPPIAASDFTLGVFGNANEDDTINMQDVTYTELIILEYRDETELSDAKYDGKINMQDVTQIELVILGKEKEITVIDSADRVVTVKKPLERMISLSITFIETTRSLKLEKDKIVGVHHWVLSKDEVFYPEFQNHPDVGNAKTPDIEKMLSLNPDVVFTYASSYYETVQKLEDVGLTVLCFDLYDPESYVEEVEKIGYIIGKKEEAAEFFDFYNGVMDTIDERTKGISEEDRPKIYFESSKLYKTCGKGAAWHHKIGMAGGNNIFGDLEGYFTVDAEEVIERNPEIIIKFNLYESGYDTDDSTGLKNVRNELMNRSELEKVSAVADGEVYAIAQTVINGPSSFIGIGYMARWFHPTIFEDLDPQAIHQEYLTEFQGLDYDLNEHGVFVYPPLEEV